MTRRRSTSPLRPIVGAGVLALVALLGVAGAKSYRDLGAARALAARHEAEIRETEESRARLARRIELLETDEVALEREVRGSLRWVRPGEIVLVVAEDESAPGGEARAESAVDEP